MSEPTPHQLSTESFPSPVLWQRNDTLSEYILGLRVVRQTRAPVQNLPMRGRPNRKRYSRSVVPGIDQKWPFIVLYKRTKPKSPMHCSLWENKNPGQGAQQVVGPDITSLPSPRVNPYSFWTHLMVLNARANEGTSPSPANQGKAKRNRYNSQPH